VPAPGSPASVDGLIAAAEAGATAAIQPGGSVRDAELIAAADERSMAWFSPACGISGIEQRAGRGKMSEYTPPTTIKSSAKSRATYDLNERVAGSLPYLNR